MSEHFKGTCSSVRVFSTWLLQCCTGLRSGKPYQKLQSVLNIAVRLVAKVQCHHRHCTGSADFKYVIKSPSRALSLYGSVCMALLLHTYRNSASQWKMSEVVQAAMICISCRFTQLSRVQTSARQPSITWTLSSFHHFWLTNKLYVLITHGTEWPILCWCAIKQLLTYPQRSTMLTDWPPV